MMIWHVALLSQLLPVQLPPLCGRRITLLHQMGLSVNSFDWFHSVLPVEYTYVVELGLFVGTRAVWLARWYKLVCLPLNSVVKRD